MVYTGGESTHKEHNYINSERALPLRGSGSKLGQNVLYSKSVIILFHLFNSYLRIPSGYYLSLKNNYFRIIKAIMLCF